MSNSTQLHNAGGFFLAAAGVRLNKVHTVAASKGLGEVAVTGGLEEVRSQIDHENVHVDWCDLRRQTALTHAAACGQLDIVKYLLRKGASVNWESIEKTTPLSLAIAHGHKDVEEALRKEGAKKGRSAMYEPAAFFHYNV